MIGNSSVIDNLAPRFYVTGGTLGHDAACYVTRRADAELYDSLKRGSFSYVLTGHPVEVFSVAFSPDGKRLASGSKDMTVKLWDVSTGRELTTLRGQADWVYSVAFSPDGKRLATGTYDRSIKLWDVATGQELTTLKGHTAEVWSVAFSPDGRTLATASGDRTVRLWRAATAEEILARTK